MLIVLGFAIVAIVVLDVLLSVVVPRPTPLRLRLSGIMTRLAWRGCSAVVDRLPNSGARTMLLGIFAPLMLIVFLLVWVVLLIFGFALVNYGLPHAFRHPLTFPDALYYAGITFFTIGFGDIVPRSGAARVLSLAMGSAGFGLIAIVTTYLFSAVGAFQRREVFVIRTSAVLGTPPLGTKIAALIFESRFLDATSEYLVQGQNWLAEILETHLAYPILAYFRSRDPGESWIATLGALLDASALVAAIAPDSGAARQAEITQRLCERVLREIAEYFRTADVGEITDNRDFDAIAARLADTALAVDPRVLRESSYGNRGAFDQVLLLNMASFWRVPHDAMPPPSGVSPEPSTD